MYLSPKSETFPFLMPASRMHVALVVLPNIWCMLVHLLAALPQGYDYNRGYLHGGVIIDFIGQRPPTSRLYFFLADLFLLILQCLMLTIHTERERLRLSLKTFRPLAPIITLEAATAPTVEDLDAEERNIGGGQPDEEEEDVELHSLGRGSQGDEAEGTESRRPNSSDDVSTSRLYDVLSSGNGVLGDHNIVRSMRAAATELERSTAQSLQSIGYGATLAALNTRRENATLRSRPQETTGNT